MASLTTDTKSAKVLLLAKSAGGVVLGVDLPPFDLHDPEKTATVSVACPPDGGLESCSLLPRWIGPARIEIEICANSRCVFHAQMCSLLTVHWRHRERCVWCRRSLTDGARVAPKNCPIPAP